MQCSLSVCQFDIYFMSSAGNKVAFTVNERQLRAYSAAGK